MNKIFFIFAVFISVNAAALQKFVVSNNDSIQVKVSAKDLTRIRMESGRIDGIYGLDDNFTYKADRAKGEIYIKPKEGSKSVSSFFIKDGFGNNYSMTAIQHAIPSETIILQPLSQRTSKSKRGSKKSTSYVDAIKTLAKSMALSESLNGYARQDKDVEVEIWNDIEINLISSYTGRKLYGEVYTIKNNSNTEQIFNESEFKEFGERVLFVGLDKLRINSGEETRVYVVRGIGK